MQLSTPAQLISVPSRRFRGTCIVSQACISLVSKAAVQLVLSWHPVSVTSSPSVTCVQQSVRRELLTDIVRACSQYTSQYTSESQCQLMSMMVGSVSYMLQLLVKYSILNRSSLLAGTSIPYGSLRRECSSAAMVLQHAPLTRRADL